MKEKIAKALKTEYASFGLSQKALDGVASIIEKTIKDESEIEAAIKEASVKELLKTFQSELDTFRQDKSRLQKEYEDYKKSHPEGNPNKKEGDDEMAKTLESIMKTQAELKESAL